MRTLAYCAASFRQSVTKASGGQPLTCPPWTADNFNHAWLEHNDFLYFKLHGMQGEPFWYGDNWVTALSANHIRNTDLQETVAFVANCHLWAPGEEETSPMLQSLLDAGAIVIGGSGENYARSNAIDGADRLGRNLRILLEKGAQPRQAFRLAMFALRANPIKTGPLRDTLHFRLFERT
jgi:hypothetical protein